MIDVRSIDVCPPLFGGWAHAFKNVFIFFFLIRHNNIFPAYCYYIIQTILSSLSAKWNNKKKKIIILDILEGISFIFVYNDKSLLTNNDSDRNSIKRVFR